jgi:hypothetical protein
MSSVFGASLSSEPPAFEEQADLGRGGETAAWDDTPTESSRTAEEEVDQYTTAQVEARLRAAESLGYPVIRDKSKEHEVVQQRPPEYDSWLLEKKVLVRTPWAEEDVGDSCCFGTRTVDMGMDCIWKLPGGI